MPQKEEMGLKLGRTGVSLSAIFVLFVEGLCPGGCL